MAHPLKSDAASAHSAKLKNMTAHYGLGSGNENNIVTPGERLKREEGEHHVGFGADSASETSKRGDRPARRAVAANPVPTYARGGKVKEELCSGGEARSTGGVIARARGGRAKHGKGATHVNVIVAPQGAGVAGAPGGPPPQLAAALAGAHPPMGGPSMPPPGAPPMGSPPPGGMPPGGPMMRARGGKVMGGHPDAAQDKNLIEETLKEEGLIRKARGGGVHMTAGAVTGIGRLEKMGIKARHRGSMSPKEI